MEGYCSCEHCFHANVCKYRDEVMRIRELALETLSKMVVDRNVIGDVIRLGDFDFINIGFECKYRCM